jgi:hypothetical protein
LATKGLPKIAIINTPFINKNYFLQFPTDYSELSIFL